MTAATPEAVLTLDQVINATLLADPKLRAGFESINQAHGDALSASLRPNPSLSVVQSLLPLTRPFTADAQGGPPQLDVWLAYPIDWFLFGKRAAAMVSAALGVRVSEAEYADLVRHRVREATTAYYDVLEAKALFELARQDLENLEQLEAVTEKAVQAGGRPQVELSRIRLDRLKSEQALRDAENAMVGAKARLWALLGRTDGAPAIDVAGTLDIEPTTPPLAVEEYYTVAIENRPDIGAMRWSIGQAKAQREVEWRKAYPEVTPKIGYTRQFQQKAIGMPDADSFGFGVELPLPLFDRNQGNRYKAASVVAQQNFNLQSKLIEVRAEVTQAIQELRTAAANTKAVAQEQLKLAEQVRDSIITAYEAGGRPLIDVLDAQRNYRDTYRLYINSRANYGRAAANFNATLGMQVVP